MKPLTMVCLAVLGMAAPAAAQLPPVPPAALPPAESGSLTRVTGAGNGVGNTIVVENTGRGTTIIEGCRNGCGNTLIVRGGAAVVGGAGIELPLPAVLPDPRDLPGLSRKSIRWTRSKWNRRLGDWVYWSPRDWMWFRYDREADRFFMVF